jgi:hypothetical protein
MRSKTKKLAELHGNVGLIGKYIRKTKGTYSNIYWFTDESKVKRSIYGNKSLDKYMEDILIGHTLKIECVDLVYFGGKYHPQAIAKVSFWNGSDFEELRLIPVVDWNHPSIPKMISLEILNKDKMVSDSGPENPLYEQPGLENQPISDISDWEVPEYALQVN